MSNLAKTIPASNTPFTIAGADGKTQYINPIWWGYLVTFAQQVLTTVSGNGYLANVAGALTPRSFTSNKASITISNPTGQAGNSNFDLAVVNTSVGTFGNNSNVATFTVNNLGLITNASNTPISGVAPSGAAGGDLGGTYPNPSVLNVNGQNLSTLSLTNATALLNLSGTNTGDQINITGNAATVTTNANLSGPINSTGNVTAVTSQTGTGSTFVMNTSPTLITPALGTPTAGTLTNCTGYTEENIVGSVWSIVGGTAATGFSGSPTLLVTKKVVGSTTFLYFFISGTSNATTFTLTGLPANAGGQINQLFLVTNSGTNSVGFGQMNGGSTVLTFFSSVGSGAWTASGTKAAYGTLVYETT